MVQHKQTGELVKACLAGPSITDRRGLKPALVKPENLRLAHWLSNKKDAFFYYIKTKYYKTVTKVLLFIRKKHQMIKELTTQLISLVSTTDG